MFDPKGFTLTTFDIFLRSFYRTPTNSILANVKSDLSKLLHGILDLLVLKALETHPRNAAGVSRWIKGQSKGMVDVGAGSLYTALHRLDAASLIAIIDRVPGTTPKAKTYEIKRAGRKELVRRARQWRQFSSTIKHIVGDEETRSAARLNLILMMALRYDWHLHRGPNHSERL